MAISTLSMQIIMSNVKGVTYSGEHMEYYEPLNSTEH